MVRYVFEQLLEHIVLAQTSRTYISRLNNWQYHSLLSDKESERWKRNDSCYKFASQIYILRQGRFETTIDSLFPTRQITWGDRKTRLWGWMRNTRPECNQNCEHLPTISYSISNRKKRWQRYGKNGKSTNINCPTTDCGSLNHACQADDSRRLMIYEGHE